MNLIQICFVLYVIEDSRCGNFHSLRSDNDNGKDGASDEILSKVGQEFGLASSCRYTNVPWSDCDPLTWLRTKIVELVKDKKFSSDNCPETREFSQTCSMEELPSGVKILLQYQKLAKEKESVYKKKIEKVNAFFEDVKNGLRSIIENQQQNVLL